MPSGFKGSIEVTKVLTGNSAQCKVIRLEKNQQLRTGDLIGNLVFNQSARNFNPLCAMAGRVTVAEVEELVEPGQLDPDEIHLPGIYVQRVLPLTAEQAADKRIERRTVRPRTTTEQEA